MFRFLLIAGFLLLFSTTVFALASCNNPDRSIDLNVDRTHENGIFQATITTNIGGGPFLICTCPPATDCNWYWQYKNTEDNPHWQTIPTSGTVADFNCTGTACSNLNPLYLIGGTRNRSITCVDQGEFEFQGRNNHLDLNTSSVRLNCYPFGKEEEPSACVPPTAGDFDQNTYCNFVNVDLWIGTSGDYNIGPIGHSVHNNADVNFQTSKGVTTIQDGGVLDLNDTEFFLGLGLPENYELGIPILFIFSLFPFLFFDRSLLYHHRSN